MAKKYALTNSARTILTSFLLTPYSFTPYYFPPYYFTPYYFTPYYFTPYYPETTDVLSSPSVSICSRKW